MRGSWLVVALAGCDAVFGLHDVTPGGDSGPGSAAAFTCPASYQHDSTGFHRVELAAKTYDQAEVSCLADQGSDGSTGFTHLLVLENGNTAEATQVYDEVALANAGTSVAFWVGLQSTGSDAAYQWVTGVVSPVDLMYPWRAGEPTGGGMCALVNFDVAGVEPYYCTFQGSFACECDDHPDLVAR